MNEKCDSSVQTSFLDLPDTDENKETKEPASRVSWPKVANQAQISDSEEDDPEFDAFVAKYKGKSNPKLDNKLSEMESVMR